MNHPSGLIPLDAQATLHASEATLPGYEDANWSAEQLRCQEAAAIKRYQALRIGLFAYFFLLIFEGALRKWLIPGLATPLLIARDPLALGLFVIAARRGLFPSNSYVTSMMSIGIISIVTAVALGHGSLIVALYGARIFLLHLPLMFLMGRVFDSRDVIRIGKWVLIISIPMALLISLQFYSPQSAWVNRGVGGDEAGSGFSGALGYFRPSATFSFTNGTTLYFSLCGAYLGYFWIRSKQIDFRLLMAATGAFLVSIPFSISRALLFQAIICIVFATILSTVRSEYSRRLPMLASAIAIAFIGLSATPFMSKGIEVMTARFNSASKSEGGLSGTLGERFLGGMASALTKSTNNSGAFGAGIGIGTNVGAQLATGSRAFLVAEEEWQRTVGELGPVLGLGVIGLRVLLAFDLLCRSYRRAAAGDPLPWMLMSFGLLHILNGGTAQPTALGFLSITGGLVLASLSTKVLIGRISSPRPLAASI